MVSKEKAERWFSTNKTATCRKKGKNPTCGRQRAAPKSRGSMVKIYAFYPDKEYIQKGKNPTCGFSLFSPAEKIHPFRALSDDKGISPSADGDQRPTALDPCRFLKKAGKNFHKRFVRTSCVWARHLAAANMVRRLVCC